jgi:hypothetical protein
VNLRRRKKMSKFKVGDKVRTPDGEGIIIGIAKTGMDKYLVEIEGHRGYRGVGVELAEGETGKKSNCRWFEENMLKLKQFTKADLKERWLVKTRNGNEYMVTGCGETVGIRNGKFTSEYLFFADYNDDLTDKNKKEWDIVEVYKPHYSKAWEREEEPAPKKMTVAEICKELGYDIEIVKEEK